MMNPYLDDKVLGLVADDVDLGPGEVDLGVEPVVLGVDVEAECVHPQHQLSTLLVLHLVVGDPVGLHVLAHLQVLQHRLLSKYRVNIKE